MADSNPSGGWVPVPDPTSLTAEAVSQAKDELRRELSALREILETQLVSIEENRRLMLQIMDERSNEVRRRFEERDLRFEERDHSRQEAVRTALSAARELNDARDAATEQASQKFEQAVQQQIEQTGVLFTAGRERLDAKIEALKERLDRGEGGTAGAAEYRTERRADYGTILAVAAIVVSVATALATILVVALHK